MADKKDILLGEIYIVTGGIVYYGPQFRYGMWEKSLSIGDKFTVLDKELSQGNHFIYHVSIPGLEADTWISEFRIQDFCKLDSTIQQVSRIV